MHQDIELEQSYNKRDIKTLANKHQSLSAYEKELLVVVLALQKWRGYLLDIHFKIRTDHFSLKYVLDQRITTPFQSKWLPKLLGFDYEIEYKKGKENVVADALLRVQLGQLFEMLISADSNELIEAIKAIWVTDLRLKAVIEGVKLKIIQQFHNSTIGGHSGVHATLKRIYAFFYWKGLRRMGKTVIMVVVDRLSKYAHFIRLSHPFTAAQLTIRVNKKHKLSTKFYGPFKVLERIRKVAYKLELPPTAQVHSVFHVSQLKRCHFEGATMGTLPLCDAQGLIAASPLKLLDRKMVKQGNRVVVYGLVQWTNGTEDDATWELLTDM
ncbi:putative mitochondrial protein [Tanacetum coccineum]